MRPELSQMLQQLASRHPVEAHQALCGLLLAAKQSDELFAGLEDFWAMTREPSSYRRTAGLQLLAANARWDREGIIDPRLPEILCHITDEKPITARQCIASLEKLGAAKPGLLPQIRAALQAADFSGYASSMRPLLEKDRARVLAALESAEGKEESPLTLKEIAKEAGVSAMTVSNVINHRTGKMSEQTRARVQAVIDKYNFVPNLSARSLSAQNSKIVVLLIPVWSAEDYNLLEDPYLSWMVGALEVKLRAAGYYVMLRSFRTVEEIFTVQSNWRVDGCLLLTPYYDEMTRTFLTETQVPTVILDGEYEGVSSLSVLMDDEEGGRLAARYLLAHGHRRLAICGDAASQVIGKRFRGFEEELQKAGAAPAVVFGGNGVAGGEAAAAAFLALEERPTALFATTDLIAQGFCTALQRAGLSLPRDCSLMGFDNLKQDDLLCPPLTSIGQDLEQKASAAVELLLKAIRTPSLRQERILLPVRVVERASVALREETT